MKLPSPVESRSGGRGDRGLDGRLAPARERADGRDQHVAALHERAHRVGPVDVGDGPLQAAEFLGQRADAPLVARREHLGARPDPTSARAVRSPV